MFRGTWKIIADKYINKTEPASLLLSEAKLCPDCDIVFAHTNNCSRCGSSNFYMLSNYLGGNLGNSNNRRKIIQGINRTHASTMRLL